MRIDCGREDVNIRIRITGDRQAQGLPSGDWRESGNAAVIGY